MDILVKGIAKMVLAKTNFMQIESKQQILKRREEIEQELVEMLKETESDFSLQHIKDAIFYEKDNDDMQKVIAMFDRGGDISELQNILDLVSDAWNYFPHQILNGLSPADKILEYLTRKDRPCDRFSSSLRGWGRGLDVLITILT